MCKRFAKEVNVIFETPDVKNLPIMKLAVWIMKNSCGSFKPMRAVDGNWNLNSVSLIK